MILFSNRFLCYLQIILAFPLLAVEHLGLSGSAVGPGGRCSCETVAPVGRGARRGVQGLVGDGGRSAARGAFRDPTPDRFRREPVDRVYPEGAE